jgi:hypothetical protein
MTTPSERTRAVLMTRTYLLDLLVTPRLPREVKHTINNLLKHYPNGVDFDTLEAYKRGEVGVECPFGDRDE